MVKKKVTYILRVKRQLSNSDVLSCVKAQYEDAEVKLLDSPIVTATISVDLFVPTEDFLWNVELKGEMLKNTFLKQGYNVEEVHVQFKCPLQEISKLKN